MTRLIPLSLQHPAAAERAAAIAHRWERTHCQIENQDSPENWREDGSQVIAYGLATSLAGADGDYFYLAGVEVSDFAHLDTTFTGIRLPAQRWAVFTHEVHITRIVSTIHAVFSHALPAAGLVVGAMPDLLERYEARFDPWTGAGGFEIWVPVK